MSECVIANKFVRAKIKVQISLQAGAEKSVSLFRKVEG